MTIRKTLLLAFLLVSLLPSTLLTFLAFSVAGNAMRGEIERSLQVESATVSEDIDKMLFERLQNAITWSRLEVMQEIQVKDIDKRLSNFLAELKSGYRDVYHELSCTDTNNRIVASSTPSRIGSLLPKSESVPLGDASGTNIKLEPLQLGSTENHATLPIRAGVTSMFKSGVAGELHLMFNWAQIYRILDQAAHDGRSVILLDRAGRIMAASADLRRRGLLLRQVPAEWLNNSKNGTATWDGTPLDLNEITIGIDRSRGFQHFPGFGWTTMVIQPTQQVLIPVRQMALVFVLLLTLTSAFAVGFSLLVAGRIARPITALTDFTRRFKRDKQLPNAPQDVGGEVGELTEAFVQTVRDLDQSRADLVRASKLAVLGELAAVMAHEIRTPLGILRSSAQMLAREPSLSSEAGELTGFIESETERLNGLVSTLLDSARPRAPNIQPNDMHKLISQSLALLAGQAEKKNITLEKSLETPNPVVHCDAEQITQVLLNLVLNALQILPPGGKVSVRCKDEHGKLLIEVADNGPGIPPEEQARVFDPFFTRREGGVGLGLAVVQQIITAHGGQIRAGSSAMGGALFTITLPHEENP